MDSLSITASAVAIIQLITDLITETKKYYKNVKNAAKGIRALIEELTSFGGILESRRR